MTMSTSGAIGRRVAVVAASLLAAVSIAVSTGSQARAMALWGKAHFAMPGPEVFPRYVEMIQRYVTQYQGLTSACTTHQSAFCTYVGRWAELIRDAETRQGLDRIERVNSFFNSFDYVPDPVNWNQIDYWATPLQFFDVDGDCEDYAIAKYYTLRGLGFDVGDLRIVIVMDENLGIHHAVLAVSFGGDILILDNQVSGVVSASRIGHYTPILSLNEAGAWRHH
ncbi:MAG: transglutaminase-like cysteine peptidase [Alphaproteobacteria bacterium]